LANNVNKLQEGISKAKASFEANSLRGLPINDGTDIIKLFHPDKYNFQVTINDSGNYYYGTLGQAVMKVYRILNDGNSSVELQLWLEEKNYWDIAPSNPCGLVDVDSIKHQLINIDKI
jgi:hypothetical protein